MLRCYSTRAVKAQVKSKAKAVVAPPLPFKAANALEKLHPVKKRSTNPKVESYKQNQAKEKEIDLGKNFETLKPAEVEYEPLPAPNETKVANIEHNLDRVLFSPGVHFLQDPRTRVFNFTPFLKKIMPVSKFDFNCISQYITASKDETLLGLAKSKNLKFFSSTSSMTSALSQFHFWLSNDRPANIVNLSKNFHGLGTTFTTGTRCPTVLVVKNHNDTGIYSVDSDKSSDKEILLSLLGHALEKLLTTSPELFNKYHRDNSHQLPAEELAKPESYHYARLGDFLMRSQLDCQDGRLPGTGTFDLKTRAVCAVRHDISHTEKHLTGYTIFKNNGLYESFEREFFELIRSAMLKYSLQARIGNMDGIFICYHNIQHIFGFQYLPLSEIDYIFHSYDDALNYRDSNNIRPHGKLDVEKIQGPIGDDREDRQMKLSSHIADFEFKASVKIWSDAMTTIGKKLEGSSYRLVVANDPVEKALFCIATPLTPASIDEIQNLGELNTNNPLSDEKDDKVKNEHRARFQEINAETSKNCIGFKIVRKHLFNGVESHQVYYQPQSLSDDWEIRYKIQEIPRAQATELYLKYLKEKEKVVWGDEEDDMNDQIKEYLKILRAYGDKGKLREEMWKEDDEKLNVWEPIKNDRNV